jgi:two-component system nitrogen regulation response regulator NtrX
MTEPEELRILIIDDDKDVRERLGNILQRRGYSILAAEDGLEGLEMVKNNAIDVIFCDIVMPKMDGLEFLNKLHEYTLKVEVIMVTGLPSVEWLAESIDKNAVEFMTKPLTIDDVLNCLNRAKRRIKEKKETFHAALERMRLNHIL